jgi:hypothetical protein
VESEDPPSGEKARVPPRFEHLVTHDKKAWIFGRLRTPSALAFWSTMLNVSTMVMFWIVQGYVLPFKGYPFQEGPDFQGLMRDNSQGTVGPSVCCGLREDFVTSAVSLLVHNGAVLECKQEELNLISPLNVVEQGEKLRLIHNLSFLNKFLEFDRFKFENLVNVAEIFGQQDWLFSIDLQSAYHHVALHPSAFKYMGFM